MCSIILNEYEPFYKKGAAPDKLQIPTQDEERSRSLKALAAVINAWRVVNVHGV
jgi:hypothetical protein